MVTYAADGTVAKSIATEHAGETRRSIWVVGAGIAGLVAGLVLGLFVASRKKKDPTPTTIQ
jgi:LPXTG-motif cell wall-anchored protein